MESVDFYLLPDKSSARLFRRDLAEMQPLIGVHIGTWPELLELAQNSYCITPPQNEWTERLVDALPQVSEAFWSESFQVDPDASSTIVSNTLADLLAAMGPNGKLTKQVVAGLSVRGRRQIEDLVGLHRHVDGILPPALDAIRSVLSAGKESAIRHIRVYFDKSLFPLDPWQRALVDRLTIDAGEPDDSPLPTMHHPFMGWIPKGKRGSGLRHLQQNLFAKVDKREQSPTGLQWLGVRDYLEEIEMAAGMVQRLIADEGAETREVGLMLPNDALYTQAAKNAFDRAGIPLSGLSVTTGRRDLGRELIYQFLYVCSPTPTPPMALAGLLSSPLLPWDRERATALAQAAIDGSPGNLNGLLTEEQAKALRLLVRKKPTSPATLARALGQLAAILRQETNLDAHVKTIMAWLDGADDIDWNALLRRARPCAGVEEEETPISLEGLAVFHPAREPWRRVKHLLVLGFSGGRYPAEMEAWPVLSEADRRLLNDKGIRLNTRHELQKRHRERFRRQLCAASDSVAFFIPRLDPLGESLPPSTSLSFMARLFEGVETGEDLILDLDKESDRAQARWLKQAEPALSKPPRILVGGDLNLGENLLTKRINKDGAIAAESPSGLEKLMVSPLAWLFYRYDIAGREWRRNELDVMTIGNIAHAVFQRLFNPRQPLPTKTQVRNQVEKRFREVVEQDFAFLTEPEWRVERRQMVRELTEAAEHWLDFLIENKACLLGDEVWLTGVFDQHPIHGKADLIFTTECGVLYVVDYKTSKSDKRRKGMEKGYDTQTSLYRRMLEKGTMPDDVAPELINQRARADAVGALYFTLKDQTVLGDRVAAGLTHAEAVENDISGKALELIKTRMKALRSGNIQLNTDKDGDWFEKEAGIQPYALDDSPLITLFLKPAEDQ